MPSPEVSTPVRGADLNATSVTLQNAVRNSSRRADILQKMVATRLIPLVMAFAMAFAPVALSACQASCLSQSVEAEVSGSAHHHHSHSASESSAPATGHVHHHIAEAQGSQSGAVMASQSHPCDHGDGVPAFSAAQNDVLAAPAVEISTFEFPQIQISSPRARATAAAPAPDQITLTTRLRV